jgi:hypothetical protein
MQFSAGYSGQRFVSTHRPDGPVKGAVLLCGPLFHEYYKAHAWLRQVALDLSSVGWFVTRFDFSGQGDSLVDPEAISLRDWLDDIRYVAEITRQQSGCAHLDVVSVRLSNLFIEPCALHQRLHVAIDPVRSGREYIQELRRRQAQLRSRQPEPCEPEEATALPLEELLGERYPCGLIESLAGLRGAGDADTELASAFRWSTISLERVWLPELGERIAGVLL